MSLLSIIPRDLLYLLGTHLEFPDLRRFYLTVSTSSSYPYFYREKRCKELYDLKFLQYLQTFIVTSSNSPNLEIDLTNQRLTSNTLPFKDGWYRLIETLN